MMLISTSFKRASVSALLTLSALSLNPFNLSAPTCNIASATVALKASLESLTEQSSLIIHARVSAQHTPKERGPRGQIYTQSQLEVIEYLKGSGAQQLTLQQLGGTLDGLTMHVSGSPELKVGEEYVLFLTSDPNTGLVHVVSLSQGVYHVEPVAQPQLVEGRERTVERAASPRKLSQDLKGLTFYEPQPAAGPSSEKRHLTHQPSVSPSEALTLEALKLKVAALVSASTPEANIPKVNATSHSLEGARP